ncbi:MAG: prepilin peptidase [Xanthomonadaceae bacterium]|nr:prepilin peptidase [Xanthomonadaceae bacterium]
MAFLDQNPALGYPIAAGLGLLVGSFLNVVILRLPRKLEWRWKRDARDELELPNDMYDPPPPGIVVEPSHCPHCQHKLSWYENIPVFSWLALGGKCRNCRTPISFQYPAVELLTMLLVVASVWRFGFGWQGFGASLLSCFLVAGAGIDVRKQLLPDEITLPLLWLGLIASVDNLFVPAKAAIAGAVLGYVSLWLVYKAHKFVTNKDGMGYGDFKLLAALGAWAGYKALLPIVLVASFVGAIIGSIWLFAKGRDHNIPIPFGPYLAAAGWIVFLWGGDLLALYQRLLPY